MKRIINKLMLSVALIATASAVYAGGEVQAPEESFNYEKIKEMVIDSTKDQVRSAYGFAKQHPTIATVLVLDAFKGADSAYGTYLKYTPVSMALNFALNHKLATIACASAYLAYPTVKEYVVSNAPGKVVSYMRQMRTMCYSASGYVAEKVSSAKNVAIDYVDATVNELTKKKSRAPQIPLPEFKKKAVAATPVKKCMPNVSKTPVFDSVIAQMQNFAA